MLPPLIDVAVEELEEFGIVKTTSLPELLVDGTNDYEITLANSSKRNKEPKE